MIKAFFLLLFGAVLLLILGLIALAVLFRIVYYCTSKWASFFGGPDPDAPER